MNLAVFRRRGLQVVRLLIHILTLDSRVRCHLDGVLQGTLLVRIENELLLVETELLLVNIRLTLRVVTIIVSDCDVLGLRGHWVEVQIFFDEE